MKTIHKKMLSFLLVFSMLVTLLPASAFSEPDAEITAFMPIVIDGGAAGSASYADAAAAIAYLNDNYTSVTASTYGGGEVSVPVAGWADTDTYDPAVAGSYTFTANLGDIPTGFANPNNLTATAELVVTAALAPEAVEITAFDPITISAGVAGSADYADAAAVIAYLNDNYAGVTASISGGTIAVPVTAWEDTDNYDPATAGSYTFTAMLGDIPTGYTLGEGVTATAEVVVAGGGGLAPGVYSVPLIFYNGFFKYEQNQTYTGTYQRIQFNHRALVTAQADGSCQVKLKVESYSLMDFIQIVDPAQAGQVKSLSEYFYQVLPGTFNCPEAYQQTLLDKSLISAETNGYYLQGDAVRLEPADPALDTGYVTFTVPNLEEDVLLKTYSNQFGHTSAAPRHSIMRFSPEQAVPLPESLVYLEGNRTMGYAWTNYVYGDATNATRDVDGSCRQFLDGLFEEAVEVAVHENGAMTATFTLQENQPDPVVSIEVASSRGPYEDVTSPRYLLNEYYGANYDQVDITDGKITLDFDDMAFGCNMRISTQSTAAYNASLAGDPYKDRKSRYYCGCLRLEPAAGGGDEELLLESNGVRLIATTNSIPANSIFTTEAGRHVPKHLNELTFNDLRNFSKDGESYLVYDTSLTSNGEAVRPAYKVILEMPIPETFDLATLTVVQAFGDVYYTVAADQPRTSDFCTIDAGNRVIQVESHDPRALTTSYMLVDRGTGLDVSALPEGLYRARVSTAHNLNPHNPSMSNAALADNTGILEVEENGSWQIYLDLQGVAIGEFFGYMSGMNYYAGAIKTPVTTLAYFADGDNLQIDAIASEYRLHYLKRVILSYLPKPDGSGFVDDCYYAVTFIIPIMDGIVGGTPGDGTAEATARLRITSVEAITDGVNPLAGYDKTILKAKMNEAEWLLETLEDGAVKTALQNAVNTAQATYAGNPDSGTVLAATQTLSAAIEAAESGTVRLEAPAIGSTYDEQNNSYTVTISSETTGTIKYRLSGSESGTGDWLDYTGAFVVDNTNELISQGVLYVLAYVASTEAGVEDSETALALLDFRGGSEPGPIEDGEYTIPVRLWHASSDQASMGDAALEQTAKLVAAEGQGTLHLTFKPLELMGLTGYLSELNLLDNIVFNQYNYPADYDLIPATVLSTYDVVDQYNGPDSSDPRCRNNPYPKDLSVPVVLEQEYTWAHVYVPVMGSSGDQVARIKLDWSNLAAAEPEDVEITAFDPIQIAAGSAGSATYSDAAAVIEYLNTNHAGVTAQVYGGGTVPVPVTGWTDTDAYDPDSAGSYTFTATLGELPAGYTLGEGVTAAAEVVVAEAEGGALADGLYTIDADALKETSDEYSMPNQFLTEPTGLTVANGQITLTMVWHGTQHITMDMVEGLWYRNSAGEFVEIIRDIDTVANTLTFSMPLTNITESVMMKIYAPAGMGYSLFRLVFHEETLTPVTEERAVYTLAPVSDETYQAGVTPGGINTMTVNAGFSGLKYFGVQVTPVREHSGNEAVVFTHQRDEAQLSLNVTRADFDAVQEAQAGFNVLAGDVINVYIVDDLTNDPDTNPIILQ